MRGRRQRSDASRETLDGRGQMEGTVGRANAVACPLAKEIVKQETDYLRKHLKHKAPNGRTAWRS